MVRGSRDTMLIVVDVFHDEVVALGDVQLAVALGRGLLGLQQPEAQRAREHSRVRAGLDQRGLDASRVS